MPAICRKSLAWTNEKLRPCLDRLDNNSAIKKGFLNVIVQFLDMYSTMEEDDVDPLKGNRGLPSHMSLPKFLAISALDLSIPATPQLLHNKCLNKWLQLSGHKDTVAVTTDGARVQKKIQDLQDPELLAYQAMHKDPYACRIIPKYAGIKSTPDGYHWIELENLLSGFVDPYVMDVKMGCRTFLEKEVQNATARADLYEKMNSIDPNTLTKDEHAAKAITKLRYMQFREALSSSHEKGFRIEALKLRGLKPVRDFKAIKSQQEIEQLINVFSSMRPRVIKDVLKRLRFMRAMIEQSPYFATHEIIGSSIFIVYDEKKAGVWLIDFAKSCRVPKDIKIDHRRKWEPGNHEEGLLYGIDQLIMTFENVYEAFKGGKKQHQQQQESSTKQDSKTEKTIQ